MAKKPPTRGALGAAIREVRHERGWTIETLASRADLHWTYVGGIERGERNPTWDTLRRISEALATPISEIAQRAEH